MYTTEWVYSLVWVALAKKEKNWQIFSFFIFFYLLREEGTLFRFSKPSTIHQGQPRFFLALQTKGILRAVPQAGAAQQRIIIIINRRSNFNQLNTQGEIVYKEKPRWSIKIKVSF